MVELSQDTIDAVIELYEDDPIRVADLLSKIVFSKNPTSMITVLNSLVSNKAAFARAAENMLQDLYKTDEYPEYRSIMRDIYDGYLNADGVLLDDGSIDEKQLLDNNPGLNATITYSLINALNKIPPKERSRVIKAAAESSVLAFGGGASAVRKLLASTPGHIATIGLVAIPLAWEAFNNIRRWWRGEISGKRCAAKLIDSLVTTGAGIGGGMAGAAVGMGYGGPVGAVVGGLVGSFAASQLTHTLMGWLTREIFDLPKSEALENAYKFLGLYHKALNSEVNTRYRELALQYHPDKDKSDNAAKNWHKLQVSMAVIKISQE